MAHAAVSPRPPISLSMVVARTEGYTYAAIVWDLSLVQRPFSAAPCRTLALTYDSRLLHRCIPAHRLAFGAECERSVNKRTSLD
jgi:hypothetical protein